MRYFIKSVNTFISIQISRWRFFSLQWNDLFHCLLLCNNNEIILIPRPTNIRFIFYAFLFGQTKRDTILFFSRRDRRTNPMIAFANIAIILSSRIKKWVFCASLRCVQLHISLLCSLLAITFFNL